MANSVWQTGLTRFTSEQCQFGNFRDTSLSSATRARELEVARQEAEALKAQQALERLEAKEREEREALALALKAKLRKMNRQQRHLERQEKEQACLVIQVHWKEHVKWKKSCIAALTWDSAVEVQRVFRGWKGRLQYQFELIVAMTRGVVLAQRLWRGVLARRERSRRLSILTAATVTGQRIWRGVQGRLRACRVRETRMVVQIQSMVRAFIARNEVSNRRVLLARRRAEADEIAMMEIEDAASNCVRNEAMEQCLMQAEDDLAHLVRAERIRKQAHGEGITLLPWRRKENNMKELVAEQMRQRRISQLREEKRQAREEQERAEERAAMLLRVEEERQTLLKKALRRKEKKLAKEKREREQQEAQERNKRKQEQEKISKETDVPQTHASSTPAPPLPQQRQTQDSTLSAEQQAREKALEERRRRHLIREHNRRIKEQQECQAEEEARLRAEAQAKQLALQEKEQMRLRKIRKKAQERKRREEREQQLALEEEEQSRRETEARKRAQEAQFEKERKERLARAEERKRRKARKAAAAEKAEKEAAAVLKKESKAKVSSLKRQVLARLRGREALLPRVSAHPARPGAARPTRKFFSGGRRTTTRLPAATKTKSAPKTRRRSKRSLKASKRSKTMSSILTKAETALLPKIKSASVSCSAVGDDPLSRALAWKRNQIAQENATANADLSFDEFGAKGQLGGSFVLSPPPPHNTGSRDSQDLGGGSHVEHATRRRMKSTAFASPAKEESFHESLGDDLGVGQTNSDSEDDDKSPELFRGSRDEDYSGEPDENHDSDSSSKSGYEEGSMHDGYDQSSSSLGETDSLAQHSHHPETEDIFPGHDDSSSDSSSSFYEEDFDDAYDEDFETQSNDEHERALAQDHIQPSHAAFLKASPMPQEIKGFEENCAARVIQLAMLRHSLSR